MSEVMDTLGGTTPEFEGYSARSRYLVRALLGTVPFPQWPEDAGVMPRTGLWPRNIHSSGNVAVGVDYPFFILTASDRLPESVSSVSGLSMVVGMEPSGTTASPRLSAEALHQWRVIESLAGLFEIASEERFEDGMESNLSAGIRALFRHNATQTMQRISDVLRHSPLKQAVIAETLNALSRIDDLETADARLSVILEFLDHQSIVIRDAAMVALCLLGDRRAIPRLERAARREQNVGFRRDLEEAIQQLRR